MKLVLAFIALISPSEPGVAARSAPQPCIVKATETLPKIAGLVVKKTGIRPMPPEQLANWKGKSKPVIVDLRNVRNRIPGRCLFVYLRRRSVGTGFCTVPGFGANKNRLRLNRRRACRLAYRAHNKVSHGNLHVCSQNICASSELGRLRGSRRPSRKCCAPLRARRTTCGPFSTPSSTAPHVSVEQT